MLNDLLVYERMMNEFIDVFESHPFRNSDASGVKPVLLHGDLNYANYLVLGQKVAALVDFDHLRVGARAEEIVRTVLGFGLKVADNEVYINYQASLNFLLGLSFQKSDCLYY